MPQRCSAIRCRGRRPVGRRSPARRHRNRTWRGRVQLFLFATGAIIPVLPFLFGLSGMTAIVVAAVLVGVALLSTGVIVGLFSGAPPLQRCAAAAAHRLPGRPR